MLMLKKSLQRNLNPLPHATSLLALPLHYLAATEQALHLAESIPNFSHRRGDLSLNRAREALNPSMESIIGCNRAMVRA